MLFLQSLRGKSSLFASYACTASSLYTYSQERDFCFSLVSSPWPSLAFPSFNLIPRLSDRAHEKRIVSRRCPLNFSCRSRLPGVPFSAAIGDTASSFVLPSTLPIELQKTTWHLLLVFPARLPLLDFFLPLLDLSAL